MTKGKRIATRPDLVAECERLGVSLKRKSEPEAETLAARYRYDAKTGAIYGPRGKLKPTPNKGAFRVALWNPDKGQAVRVLTGRLAFALEHGRWPVGVFYLNGDTSDNRAVNLAECRSVRLKKAAKRFRVLDEPRLEQVDAADRLGRKLKAGKYSLFDLRSRRGAWSGGRCLPDELRRIDRVLEGGGLSRRDRAALERQRDRFKRALEPVKAALAESEAALKTGAEKAPHSPKACVKAVPKERKKRLNRCPNGRRYRALKLMAWRMARHG